MAKTVATAMIRVRIVQTNELVLRQVLYLSPDIQQPVPLHAGRQGFGAPHAKAKPKVPTKTQISELTQNRSLSSKLSAHRRKAFLMPCVRQEINL